MNPEIKKHVKDQTAKFVKAEKGHLHYKTTSGLEFKINMFEIGGAVLPCEAPAMLFVRWIRQSIIH